MSDDRPPNRPERIAPSAVERHLERSRIEARRMGALSSSSLQRERTIEAYLRAGVVPRYMERLREIHQATDHHRRRLAGEYERLAAAHAGDPAAFARAWRARVETWRFDEVNQLVREHNEWYPIERDLPMDPRTRDYVPIAGRSYRREELTPEWALAQFPAELAAASRPGRPR
jgi:hypothetical protein